MCNQKCPFFITHAKIIFLPKRPSLPSQTKRHIACIHASTPSTPKYKQIPSTLDQLRNSRAFLRQFWETAIAKSGSNVVIDATSGRGSDCITLGRLVGRNGTVYAFDIQQVAVEETRTRYEDERSTSKADMGELVASCTSHESFASLLLPKRSVSCVVYNLGWYPGRGADRSIITLADSTVASLQSAEELVAVNGLISVTAYVGHVGGKKEKEAVLSWASQLCSKVWNVAHIVYPNRELSPSIVVCERLS